MNISFEPLQGRHFSLLLKWLETSHVKAWWDQSIKWTIELIEEKYGPYVDGYKIEGEASKPVYAYIVLVEGVEIGYIQYYNAYDFPRDEPIDSFPQSLAAFDILIGEAEYINKGIGARALRVFCDEYIFKKFENCIVDPDVGNIAAFRAYKKAGFIEVKRIGEVVWMIKSR